MKISRELLLMTVAMVIANTAGSMVWTLLPLYLEELGASVQEIGFYFTIEVVMSIFFRILGGWLSDHTGRLPTIAWGGVVGLGAYLIFAIAPTWQLTIVGALLGAISGSLVSPSFQAYTAEQAPEESRGSAYGMVQGMFLICMIIGPLMGGVMAQELGYRAMLWTAAGIYGAATVMRVWMARGTRFELQELHVGELRRDIVGLLMLIGAGGLLAWLFVVDGLIDSSMQIAMPFAPKYITENGNMNEAAYGGLVAWMSVVGALAMLAGGMFSDRYGERWSIGVGLVAFCIVWGLFVLIPGQIVFIVAFSLVGVSQAFIVPAFSALLSKAVPANSLGITWGVFDTARGTLAVPAPSVGGWLYDHVAPWATFAASGLATLIALPITLRFLRTPPTQGEPETAPEVAPQA